MQLYLGWILIIFPGILFFAQVISSISFAFAQRLGIQETEEHNVALVLRAVRYVAYWDLITLVWMPLAGLLMVLDHSYWPVVSLLAGAIYFDTSGREAAKNLSFRHEGLRVGPPGQSKFFFSTYIMMAALAIATVSTALLEMM